jgi:esterase/lipase superfamily enzyme
MAIRLLFVFVFLLSACTDRGSTVLMPSAIGIGTIHRVFVTTERIPDETGWFGADRSEERRYLAVDVSVPPNHKAGQIKAGYRNPNPQRSFVVAERSDFASNTQFRAELGTALKAHAPSDREVVLYVHGYNNSFLDGVYRSAQLMHDFELPGEVVHFAWPSAAHPLGYTYDRDSLLIARDGLEQTLRDISASGAKRIILVAHSLGTMLSMETLRQIEIREPGWSRRHLGGVVLISPDLDVELFRTQAGRIRELPQPFAIFVSQKDRVLALSSLINGVGNRLGNLADPVALADFPVTVLDVSDFSAGAGGHFTAGTSPALINILNRSSEVDNAFQLDRAGKTGLLSGTILTVQKATTVILSPDVLVTGKRLN